MSNQIKSQILRVIKEVQGSGSFMTSGVNFFTFPGLKVNGSEEIGFPINSLQAQQLIDYAHQAPFGKGIETITDTSVRKAWEIDAADISFENEEWADTIQGILKKVKKGLGIEKHDVKAVLYKLLVYEKGGFFLPHKDSEKEKGMFATMVVGLPSQHTGGELFVRFAGNEEDIDFSYSTSNYKIPFGAFYADCEHEIKPVTSGYRVCLVYNLVQKSGSELAGPEFSNETQELADLLGGLTWAEEGKILPVLLGHEYTPTNFSLENLKLHDRPRAEALIAAAHKAGFYAKLGLITHYKMGELEGDGGYYGYDDDDEGEGEMGEVYEEYTRIENWGEDGMPSLGNLEIKEKDILTEIELGEGNPTEQEQEGYTGNAGMTIEYWYHYGAIILWKKSGHMKMIATLPIHVRMEWLGYFVKNWQDKTLDAPKKAKQLIADINEEDVKKGQTSADFSSILAALTKLKDEGFLKDKGSPLLSFIFDRVNVKQWVDLLQTFNNSLFDSTFSKIGARGDISDIEHLTNILKALNDIKTTSFINHQIEAIPDYLKGHNLSNLQLNYAFFSWNRANKRTRKEHITGIIKNILDLNYLKSDDKEWNDLVVERLTSTLPRDYVHEVVAPILLSGKHQRGAIFDALDQIIIQQLQKWTKIKPTPPENWSRAVPKDKDYNNKTWEMLRSFLESPTQQSYDYTKNENYRQSLASIVNGVTIDLKMTTIKIGRPYTLRLTKTQANYEAKSKVWKEDMILLDSVLKIK